MKYFFAVVFFTLVSFETYAGDFDGVWSTDSRPGEYFMMRSVGATVVFVRLGDNYEIYLGNLNDKNAHIETFKGEVAFTADINFVSNNEATLSVLGCAPIEDCDFKPGTVLAFKKFF